MIAVLALRILAGGLALVVVAGIAWRAASRRRSLPCPSWLAWSLGLPIMQRRAGKSSVIDRLSLSEGTRVAEGRATDPCREARSIARCWLRSLGRYQSRIGRCAGFRNR